MKVQRYQTTEDMQVDVASTTGLRALPSATIIGFQTSLTSEFHGTVGWTIPGGYTVQYARKPGGWDMAGWPDASGAGVPVLSKSGGVMTATLVAPLTYEISGDYAETISGWHPSNEGANLITCCTAGVGALWTPIASTTSGVQPAKTRPLIWAPEWGNAGWYWDGTTNNPDNDAPTFQTDTAAVMRKSYLMRTAGGSTGRYYRCTAYPAAGAFRIHMAGNFFNVTEDFGSGGQGLPTLNSSVNALVLSDTAMNPSWGTGLKGGIQWVNAVTGGQKFYWQGGFEGATVAYGTKPAGANVLEKPAANVPWLVTAQWAADGKCSIYVGGTLVTNTTANTTPFAPNVMRFGSETRLPLNLLGICAIQGAADGTQLAKEVAYFKARWGVA